MSGIADWVCIRMKTFYEVLDIRPGADAEAVKRAFREAAKSNHPDHHPDDPDAPLRFKRIAAAYHILRDERRRATYDRRLALERQRIRSRLMRIVISGAGYGVLTIILVIVFTRMQPIPSTSIRTDKVEFDATPRPTELAGVPSPARDNATDRNEHHDGLEVIPERPIEPSAFRPATDDVPAIPKIRPYRRPLPNALGDITQDGSGQVSAHR